MSGERVQAILDALRARGERVTTARRALLTALDDATDHCSADELAVEVRRLHPEIHRATIYRTLETLRRLEVVEHTHLGHGPAVYHLADRVHQHLVCEKCGSVTEVPPAVLWNLEVALKRDYGFSMKSRHFAVVGTCRACAESEAEASDPEQTVSAGPYPSPS